MELFLKIDKNMNMKKNEQSNGAKLCFKLVLNKLKVMGDTTFIYTPLGI